MTKQEEIREGIVQGVNLILLHNLVRMKPTANYIDINETPEYRKWLEDEVDKEIIKLAHSQGVVIRVDRELPDEVLIGVLKSLCDRLDVDRDLAEIKAIGYVLDMLKAGYVAVEPLMENNERTYQS